MRTTKLTINAKSGKYPIYIGSELINNTRKILLENSITFSRCLIVFDKKVPKKNLIRLKKNLKKKEIFTYFLKPNELNKNQKTVNQILEVLLKKNFSRNDCLISMGGGITGDIGGFVASLFKRGIKFINIPTTLLSQVDSSIGGKTGVNTKYGKNLIGSFHQPKLVLSDTNFLKSLPKREIICGYAEILKHAIISSKKNFLYLNKNISNILSLKSPFIEKAIFDSCKTKKNVVEKDENEKNLRKILNFGHTFAHAYEASLGYSKKLNHGEAVLLGMMTALNFSNKKNFLKNNELISIINHYNKSKLPINLNKYFSILDINKIISFMTKDKKNYSNNINLILLKKIGYVISNKEYKKNYIKSFLRNELKN